MKNLTAFLGSPRRRQVLPLAAGLLLLISPAAGAETPSPSVGLTVASASETHGLGELLELSLQFENRGFEPVQLAGPNVEGGRLRLFVSEDGRHWAEYVAPTWGISDAAFAARLVLEPGQAHTTRATVFYNVATASADLRNAPAYSARPRGLEGPMAFTRAGTFWLKATFTDGRTAAESEPLELTLHEPTGSDGAIWKAIEADPQLAYLLHTGVLAQEGSWRAYRELADLHATSPYAARIHQRLNQVQARHRARNSPAQ